MVTTKFGLDGNNGAGKTSLTKLKEKLSNQCTVISSKTFSLKFFSKSTLRYTIGKHRPHHLTKVVITEIFTTGESGLVELLYKIIKSTSVDLTLNMVCNLCLKYLPCKDSPLLKIYHLITQES